MRKYSGPFREIDDLAIGYINGDPVATREFKRRAYEAWSTNIFEEFYRTTSLISQAISQSFRRWWHGEQKGQTEISEEGK
ncbi:MAG: hypothetical protein HY512_00115 [Candidatus Aenigmarchaeota archaeon]|nr:hypothetical protein [Candidatus Aenigmarchaeota archaeon]